MDPDSPLIHRSTAASNRAGFLSLTPGRQQVSSDDDFDEKKSMSWDFNSTAHLVRPNRFSLGGFLR